MGIAVWPHHGRIEAVAVVYAVARMRTKCTGKLKPGRQTYFFFQRL